MNKIKLKNILRSISTILVILLAPLLFIALQRDLYITSFYKYDVYSNFPNLSTAEANENFDEILGYIKFQRPSLSNFYSEEDQIHMRDVRNLFAVGYGLLILGLLIQVFIKPNPYKIQRISHSFLIGLVIIIFLLDLLLGFDKLFVTFHQILFRNDYWMLDPATSNLIKYFPEALFKDFATFIGLAIVVLSSAGLIRTFLNGNQRRSKEKDNAHRRAPNSSSSSS